MDQLLPRSNVSRGQEDGAAVRSARIAIRFNQSPENPGMERIQGVPIGQTGQTLGTESRCLLQLGCAVLRLPQPRIAAMRFLGPSFRTSVGPVGRPPTLQRARNPVRRRHANRRGGACPCASRLLPATGRAYLVFARSNSQSTIRGPSLCRCIPGRRFGQARQHCKTGAQ